MIKYTVGIGVRLNKILYKLICGYNGSTVVYCKLTVPYSNVICPYKRQIAYLHIFQVDVVESKYKESKGICLNNN